VHLVGMMVLSPPHASSAQAYPHAHPPHAQPPTHFHYQPQPQQLLCVQQQCPAPPFMAFAGDAHWAPSWRGGY
jgi:hypothetical protein